MDTYQHTVDQLIPDNDDARVKALSRYQIFNDQPEPVFDKICEMARDLFEVPIAHISFLGPDTELVKAGVGLDQVPFEVDRAVSLCALTVLNEAITHIPDALLDERLVGHPYVYGEFGLRFYAGVPIFSRDGFVIGTLCLVDRQPRQLSIIEQSMLQKWSGLITEQLELKLANLEHSRIQANANTLLFESEQRLMGILDTMAEGLCIVDAKGKATYINQMAQHIFGVNLPQLQRREYNDESWLNTHLDGTVMEIQDHPMYIMLHTGKPVYDHEIGIRRAGHEDLYISVNAAPLFDEKNNLSGGVCSFMDVTARRKLMNEKDDFISIASHELKTPVTSLRASLQILNKVKSDQPSTLIHGLITQANKSMDKLNSLVMNLLQVNGIRNGQLQLHKTIFTISTMIGGCCDHISLQGDYRLDVSGDLKLEVRADEHRIEQVIINMVDNAIKYAPESKKIGITILKDGNFAKINVMDSGQGIAAEKIPHLFERYYRSDYKEMRYSGLGLGLFISADIVRKHGGEIGVSSEKGVGTTFWFTIPISG